MSINMLRRIAKDESGATVIEYTMIATLVAGVIFFAVRDLGARLSGSIVDITTVLN